MRTIDTYGTFEDIMVTVGPQVQALARRLRALIAGVLPAVVEVPWPSQRVIGYGVGPKKQSEHFCYIAVSDHAVNLGFNYGAELSDPEQMLAGSGKLFRHVKMTQLEEVDRPAVRQLLEVASRHRMP